MKDWIGNKKAIYTTLGASNHSEHEREENDYYATDPQALEILLERLKKDDIFLDHYIWECACGEGHLSEVLKKHGYNVQSSDLINRGYKDTEILDFLSLPKGYSKSLDIITNPPYKYAKEFVQKALDVVSSDNKVIMFLKIQFWESKSRKKLLIENPPKYVYVHSERQKCALNGDFDSIGSSAACYCWFIWEKAYQGDTITRIL